VPHAVSRLFSKENEAQMYREQVLARLENILRGNGHVLKKLQASLGLCHIDPEGQYHSNLNHPLLHGVGNRRKVDKFHGDEVSHNGCLVTRT